MVMFNQGDIVILDCVSMGTPQPEVSWFQDSVPVPTPDTIRISQAEDDSLVIDGVIKSDEGEYICQASNSAGTVSAAVTLIVNGGSTATHSLYYVWRCR